MPERSSMAIVCCICHSISIPIRSSYHSGTRAAPLSRRAQPEFHRNLRYFDCLSAHWFAHHKTAGLLCSRCLGVDGDVWVPLSCTIDANRFPANGNNFSTLCDIKRSRNEIKLWIRILLLLAPVSSVDGVVNGIVVVVTASMWYTKAFCRTHTPTLRIIRMLLLSR